MAAPAGAAARAMPSIYGGKFGLNEQRKMNTQLSAAPGNLLGITLPIPTALRPPASAPPLANSRERNVATPDIQLADWDALVARHPRATVYHTSGWMQALQSAFPHIQGHLLGWRSAQTGEMVAGLALYVLSSWLLGNRLVSIPLGTLCDPLVDGPEMMLELKAQLDYLCRARSIRCVCLKSRHRLLELEAAGFRLLRRRWHHYLPLGENLEQLKRGFSRTNVRQWLQRAERAELTVERCAGPEAIATFYPLFVNTRLRLGLPWPPSSFFEALAAQLGPEKHSVFIVKQAGLPLAAVLTFHFKDTLILEALGEGETARKLGAVQLAYWTATQWAFARGYKFVSFGQTDQENSGLAQHKRAWGCLEEELFEYQYAPSGQKPFVRLPGRAAKSWMRPLFQRMPRQIGTAFSRFVYRHWG